jgi:hypothetical protein
MLYDGRLLGDFYSKTDVVTRGLTFTAPACDDYEAKAVEPACQFIQQALTHEGENQAINFSLACQAPSLPNDKFFQLERTTVTVSCDSAALVGNRIMEFMRSEVVSSILKVNHTKFTIKADVCLDHFFCTVKVRMYKGDVGQYSVELQQRSGDSIAFSRLYTKISEYLATDMPVNRMSMLRDHCRPSSIEPKHSAWPCTLDVDAEGNLAPLLYLAGNSEDVALQAEAVSGLARAAQDNAAAQLCTPEAFALLQQLTQVVSFSVAEPLSRILGSLAVLPQANPHSDFFSLRASLKDNRFVTQLSF